VATAFQEGFLLQIEVGAKDSFLKEEDQVWKGMSEWNGAKNNPVT